MKLEVTFIGILLVVVMIINLSLGADEEKKTYMGVDANDKDAVDKKQKELNHEKWQELFGSDADINHIDFSPDFSNPGFKEGVNKVKDALKTLLGLFNRRPQDLTTSTTPAPQG